MRACVSVLAGLMVMQDGILREDGLRAVDALKIRWLARRCCG